MADRMKRKDAPGDPVQEAMGNFGAWHLVIVVSLSLVKFPVAWQQLGIVFLAPEPDFACAAPPTVGNTSMQCNVVVENGSLQNCTKFTYNRAVFRNSIVSEWDLVCDRAQLTNILQSATMFGILVGNMIFGMIADRIGRKIPLIIAVVIQTLSGLASAYSPWYELFLVLKFIAAVATGGTMLTSFVLIMEIVGVKWRPICSVLFHVPFIVGHMISPAIFYFTRTWDGFQTAVSIPSLFLLAYYWIIPESPRWLLAVGKKYEAEEILMKAATRNKISLEKVKDAMEDHGAMIEAEASIDTKNKKYNMTHLFRTPNLRKKTIYVCTNWLACGICFFGLNQYIGKLGGNIFVNVAASTAMELPGTVLVLYLISRVSRLKILIGGNLLSGLSLLLLTVVISNRLATVCLSTLGLVGMSISFPTIYLYSTEAFPTVVRNVGLGLASLCARVGSMVAPFIAGLGTVQPWLPPLLFCIGPFIGAGLCFLLPETMDCDLPDSIEDGENFGKGKRRQTPERIT